MNISNQLVVRVACRCALIASFISPLFAEQSKRGLFEGNLPSGGKVLFFVQANQAISAYVFNSATHQASFGGAAIATNGAFTVTTFPSGTVTGNSTFAGITANISRQTITAPRVQTFGLSDDVGGRFSGNAMASAGNSFDARFIIDSQNRIFLVGTQGSNVIGGLGTISLRPAAASATAAASGEIENEMEHEDELEDEHEDEQAPKFSGTFTITLISGQNISGTLSISHGRLIAIFPFNGTTFTFRGAQESSENHLVNISTRGFVTTGQGQLIGGFIISGGPKLVLIRALGPTLTGFGVNPALADPQLKLVQGQTVLAQNDNWPLASNAGEIAASGFAPPHGNEPALLVRLEPGNYTPIVTGANNGTGIALVEVYEIEHD